MKNIKGYVSKEEIKKAVRLLDNAQDQFILMAIYNGIAGEKEMCDLLSLKISDVDFNIHSIKIGDSEIFMDKEFENITEEAINQTVYYIESDSQYVKNEIDLISSDYVIKMASRSKNAGLTGIGMNYGALRKRFYTIKSITGLDVNMNELKTSGFINRLLEKKKDWTVMDIEFEQRTMNLKETYNSYRVYKIIKEIQE